MQAKDQKKIYGEQRRKEELKAMNRDKQQNVVNDDDDTSMPLHKMKCGGWQDVSIHIKNIFNAVSRKQTVKPPTNAHTFHKVDTHRVPIYTRARANTEFSTSHVKNRFV